MGLGFLGVGTDFLVLVGWIALLGRILEGSTGCGTEIDGKGLKLGSKEGLADGVELDTTAFIAIPSVSGPEATMTQTRMMSRVRISYHLSGSPDVFAPW